MDALGLFSSGLFSGYTIIWAGGSTIAPGKSYTAANGSFLIITSAFSSPIVMTGFMIISNGKSAYGGGFGYSDDTSPGFESGFIGVKYSGSSISPLEGALQFSGFIIS